MALKVASKLVLSESISDALFDAVIVVSHSVKALEAYPALKTLHGALTSYSKINASLDKGGVSLVQTDAVSSQRLIYSSTGSVSSDFDDARRYVTAGQRAVRSALSYGVKFPLLIVVPYARFPYAEIITTTGALHPSYVPYHRRVEENAALKLSGLGLFPIESPLSPAVTLTLSNAIDRAFLITRDIGEGDPQRFSPPRVAEYVQKFFAGSKDVKVTVEDDQAVLEREYPLLAAVNRAANDVKDHQARVVWLEYENNEPVPKGSSKQFETLHLVGKGVTLDTGGLDVKYGGNMVGMCRDKYGAAVIAGFFEALNILKPKGIKVRGALCLVRNSIGPNAYSCDEIITARSKKRIQIINTDAEGRVTMLDPLTKVVEDAAGAGKDSNPHVYTLATLTGHQFLTYGHYAALMDNGPARNVRHAENLQATGDTFGQPVEISRLHYEDLEFNDAENYLADLRQGNNKASVATIRGHMSPAGFLIRGSRLDEHGIDSETPIKYTHIDMAAASLEAPLPSYPNPLLALIAYHIVPRT